MNSILTDPRLAGLEIGTPSWFGAQREMIKSKPLIRRCYDLWYRRMLADAASVPSVGGSIVELGSGSSYIKEICPDAVTSDVLPGIADRVIDGRDLPFGPASVRAILLTHVFHHIPDVALFLEEARRVLVPGGVISMVECAHTPFARLFFSHVHPEPYDDRRSAWAFAQRDSMLDSNQALSWIVFFRDRREFERRFPGFEIQNPEYLPWLTYLLSGGVNLRSLVPGSLAGPLARLDHLVRPLDRVFAIHWHLTIRKRR